MFKKIFGSNSDRNIDVQDSKENLSIRNTDYYKVSQSLIKDILNIMKTELDESKLHIENIPEKKLNNVVNIYNIDKCKAIALYDTTVFKSGKDGLLLCNDFIGLKHAFGQINIIKFDELVIGRMNLSKKNLEIGNNIIDFRTDEFKDVLQNIKEILVLQDSNLKLIYDNHIICKLNEIELSINNKNFDIAEKYLNQLEETIITGSNHYAPLYYYGSLIRMNQLQFQQSYEYLQKLENLKEWDPKRISDLKRIIDENKLNHEFNLLEKKKNTFIQQNEYDNAIDTVYEQNTLNIKSYEELSQEVIRIKTLKESYIKSLEENVVKDLNSEKYDEALSILEKLKEINSDKSYDEYYLTAKIGIYKFESVEVKIREMKKYDKELALRLEQKLIITREDVSKKIRKAVKEKNYEIFEKDYNLRYAKDIWGMPPIMHFILNKDIEGVKSLADTFEYFKFDRNVIGHYTLNLIALDLDDSFCIEALDILDQDLQKLKKKYKMKSNLSKLGKLAINGIDSLNGKAFLSFEVAEITTSAESSINNSLDKSEREIESYISEVLLRNYKKLIAYLAKPHDFLAELDEEISCKNKLEKELIDLKNQKYEIESSIDTELNMAIDNSLEVFLEEAAIIDLGEKDEFETTAEYNERKRLKSEEIKASYSENSYIKDKIYNLEQEVKGKISQKIADIEASIEDKTNKYENTQSCIEKIYYLLNCKSRIDINQVISYYYDVYKSKIEIGTYDADSEIFNINANGNESKIKITRSIAKDFKDNFNKLNPIYSNEFIKVNEECKIQHYFTYEYKFEKVKILFMTNIIK